MRSVVKGKDTENLFEILAEKSPVGVYIVQGGKFCYANPAFQRFVGYWENELMGKDSLELVFPEDRETVRENAVKMLKGELASAYQFRVIHKTGDIRWVMESVSSIRYRGRRATLGCFVDITERKQVEEKLEESEKRYRLLFETSPNFVAQVDIEGRFVTANPAMAESLGMPLEELIGKTYFDVMPQEVAQRRLEMARKALNEWQTQIFEDEREGRHFHHITVPMKIPGQEEAVQVIAGDITERKKMEQAMRQASEEWKKTFDSISDGISIHGKDYRIQRANKAFADMFHIELHQVVGKCCYELHKGTKPISGCPHQQTLATKEPAAAEFYESRLGKYFLESTSPILDKQGDVVATVHVTRDVTKQKQLNEQLMMADRLASIGELASGAAHELNNPLTSVIGFSQLLMDRDVPDDIREDLRLIHDEAQRATCVVKNLLTFARRHPPAKQLSQINSIIDDVLRLRAYEQKIRNIEVKRKLAPALPEIMVDYFQMEQVFLNIILNAEYSMSEAQNRGTLTITTGRRNNTVVISVADDGLGIAEEHLSQLFNPFFTTKKAGKGTGLGLSICHGIVTEHGGRIYARSQPGEGATFFVELPIDGA